MKTRASVTLDKVAYPLMMHLSIVPKYEITDESFSYDPRTQTSNIAAMSGSWCTISTSTGVIMFSDSDQREDD